MKTRHSIAAIVPIYNERDCLPHAIEELDRFLAAHVIDYELIIVESGSTDGSADVCDLVARRLERVRVHHEGARRGFGSAVRQGYGLARMQWVWPVTVDMPFRFDTLLDAIPYLDDHDAVLSCRENDPRSLYRRFQSFVFNGAGRVLLGIRAKHINSAFKLLRTSSVRAMPLVSTGWLLDAEMLMYLRRQHARTVEIPVELVPRTLGRSTIGPAAVVRTVFELFRLAMKG